jgi:hypothetical protein
MAVDATDTFSSGRSILSNDNDSLELASLFVGEGVPGGIVPLWMDVMAFQKKRLDDQIQSNLGYLE